MCTPRRAGGLFLVIVPVTTQRGGRGVWRFCMQGQPLWSTTYSCRVWSSRALVRSRSASTQGQEGPGTTYSKINSVSAGRAESHPLLQRRRRHGRAGDGKYAQDFSRSHRRTRMCSAAWQAPSPSCVHVRTNSCKCRQLRRYAATATATKPTKHSAATAASTVASGSSVHASLL